MRPHQQQTTSRHFHFYRIPPWETVWATRAKTAQCKVASWMQWNKTKLPKHYEYYFSFFTSCLNSTVSLPSSSFVLTKDILTQVRKPPENFQLEYELSQSFMNFAFSGLKEKKKPHYFIDQTEHCRQKVRPTGTSNYVHNSFYSPPDKLNTSRTLGVVMFSWMAALQWCILNCRGALQPWSSACLQGLFCPTGSSALLSSHPWDRKEQSQDLRKQLITMSGSKRQQEEPRGRTGCFTSFLVAK